MSTTDEALEVGTAENAVDDPGAAAVSESPEHASVGGDEGGETDDVTGETDDDTDDAETPGEGSGDGDDDDALGGEELGDEQERQARARTEKEIEKRHATLQREQIRHLERVATIMGDDAEHLIPCPVCMDGIAGLIYPPDVAPLEPEAIARIRTVIGLPDYSTFLQAPDAVTCPECDGLGEVITGSHVPGYEVKTCRLCKKVGYMLTQGEAQPPPPEVVGDAEIVTGPTVFTDEQDPEVAHLRARGFTVFPPLPIHA